jgi:hypothetical protein
MDCIKEAEVLLMALQATQISDEEFAQSITLGLHNGAEDTDDERVTMDTPPWEVTEMAPLFDRLTPQHRLNVRSYWYSLRERVPDGWLASGERERMRLMIPAMVENYVRDLLASQKANEV